MSDGIPIVVSNQRYAELHRPRVTGFAMFIQRSKEVLP